MIAALTGRLLEKRPNRIVLDVHGVGYEVHVPLSTFYQMSELGDEITLQIEANISNANYKFICWPFSSFCW